MDKPNYEVYEYLLDWWGLRTSDVCKKTGVDPSSISNWKRGKYSPKSDKLNKIADFFNIAPWDFWSSLDSFKEKYAEYEKELCEVSAGQGRINEYFEVSTQENYTTVKIVGDSMYPTLHDGDLVRVHTTTEALPSDYAIVKVNGDEVTCKHVEITSDGIWLKAENKDVFEDKFYSIQEVLTLPVTIIGTATEIVSRKL